MLAVLVNSKMVKLATVWESPIHKLATLVTMVEPPMFAMLDNTKLDSIVMVFAQWIARLVILV